MSDSLQPYGPYPARFLCPVDSPVKNTRVARWSEWLLSKSLETINAGEGVEKRESSYMVGGNAN